MCFISNKIKNISDEILEKFKGEEFKELKEFDLSCNKFSEKDIKDIKAKNSKIKL